ncbi:MAG: hypothetical protein J6N99_01755, partial [Schwartzia sp.]|nr:hypothetical protein [Schwartzia sp. (in: firmicutes)]
MDVFTILFAERRKPKKKNRSYHLTTKLLQYLHTRKKATTAAHFRTTVVDDRLLFALDDLFHFPVILLQMIPKHVDNDG